MNQETEWWEKYLSDPADIFTGRCVPEATGRLEALIAEAKRLGAAEERERVRGIVEGMDELPYVSKRCQNNCGFYCNTCEQAWEYCSCAARNSGYKRALKDVSRHLSEPKDANSSKE